jgi:Galactose-1-phosphate uridyltransferase
MGRAILPARLKSELKEVERYLLKQPNKMMAYHKTWADQLQAKYSISADNVEKIVAKETGLVFARVFEDAGVFKWDTQGQEAFDKFIGGLK